MMPNPYVEWKSRGGGAAETWKIQCFCFVVTIEALFRPQIILDSLMYNDIGAGNPAMEMDTEAAQLVANAPLQPPTAVSSALGSHLACFLSIETRREPAKRIKRERNPSAKCDSILEMM